MAKSLDYTEKELEIWVAALGGDEDSINAILQTPIRELGVFVFALQGDKKAVRWLLAHECAHLAALVHSVEGSKKARKWLIDHEFDMLSDLGLALDDDKEAFDRFVATTSPMWHKVMGAMRQVIEHRWLEQGDNHYRSRYSSNIIW